MLVLNYHNITNRKYSYDNRYELTVEEFLIHVDYFVKYFQLYPQNNNILNNDLVLTFDDGFSSHFDIVLPILKKTGIKALFFPRTEMLNKKGFLTSGQLLYINDDNHLIGNHFHGHMDCSKIHPDVVLQSFYDADKILRDLLKVNHVQIMAPPFGKVTPEILSLIEKEDVVMFTTNRAKNMNNNGQIIHRINVDSNLSIAQIDRLMKQNFFEWEKQKLRMRVKNLLINTIGK